MYINTTEIKDSEKLRAFFAIMIPKPLQEKIAKVISVLKKNPVYQNIRWTKPKNLHITLRFLGSITKQQLAAICNNIVPILSKIQPVVVNFNDLLLFPKKESPIALVLKPVPINLALAELALTIDTCVLQHGVSTEKRTFNPHLTLARIKNKLHGKNIEKSIDDIKIPELILEVKEVKLMKSEPTPLGSNYKEIARFMLGDTDAFVE